MNQPVRDPPTPDPPAKRPKYGPVALVLLVLIRAYQLTLSAFMGRQCRYLPTCSDYAAEAVRKHGAWAGVWMAMARLQRCRPGGDHGFDPVPLTLPEDASWIRPWRYGVWRLPSEEKSG